ncbi:MAG: tetratricopeptide repeat protein [Candidatus Riflebacteria bacterium]|nr:tetratricopeptide repeat protein [Candidatus Riflebacteria bacterium]
MKYLWPSIFFLFFGSFFPLYSADYLAEGQSYEVASDPVKAIQSYLTGIKDSPSEELYIAAGKLMGKMKKYERGDKLVDEGLKKYPESQALLKLGVLFKSKLKTGPALPTVESSAIPETLRPTESPLEPLPEAQQATAAAEIIIELQKIEPENVAVFETGLQKLIFTCPKSIYASEACWKLANLYLFAPSGPDYAKAVTYLEKILAEYPDSPGFSSCFTRLKNIAEKTENYQLLQKTASKAQTFKIWSEEEQNFWKCHEAVAMIKLDNRGNAMTQLQQVAASRDTIPRAAEYADFLMNNL